MARRLIALDIYRSAIPMRSFEHAAARREVAEAIITRARFSDGSEGWGETLPRAYVTGETLESVIEDIQRRLWPAALQKNGDTFEFSAEASSQDKLQPRENSKMSPFFELPLEAEGGRRITAAACAVDLALSGLWLGGLESRRPIETRVSGVLGSSDPRKTVRKLRLMRLYGLRDFKLKLGFGKELDEANLRGVCRVLGKSIACGRATLRVDVNGGWTKEETPRRAAELAKFGVCVVEQPVFCTAGELVELARKCPLPLMADESLVSEGDARMLISEPRIWWNIRLSKNGGLAACLRLADMARDAGVNVVIGCMVGETGILSTAQRHLLQRMTQPPRFVEGNYGRFLLKDDIVRRSMRFGYGGKLRPTKESPQIDLRKLQRYAKLVATLQA